MTPSSGTAGTARPIYAGAVEWVRAAVLAGSRARLAGRWLIRVIAAPDPAPVWRSPWRRRAASTGLAAATVLAGVTSVTSLLGPAGLNPLVGLKVANWRTTVTPRTSVQVAVRLPVLFHPGWRVFAGPAVLTVAAVLIALAVVVPVPLAVRYPLLSWRIAWAGMLLVPLTGVRWWGGGPWDPVQIPSLLLVFCVSGIRHPRPVLWWMWGLSLIPWCLQPGGGDRGIIICAAGAVGFTGIAVAVDAAGSRRRAEAEYAERSELERARQAVLEERARIARELHDVVAHHLSLMAVRAETAPYRLADLPAPVRDEFSSLSGAAREALTDMRRLLGVLRDDRPATRAPQPQLADLPLLIDAARQAGMPVALSVPPVLEPVPSAVGICAYRIVQESLSNASRHAQGAAVTVSVGHDADGVVLRVANGPGSAGAEGPAGVRGTGRTDADEGTGTAGGTAGGTVQGRGHGLTGMRERVALLGGSLSAGPVAGGGFVVSAVLPLGSAI
jgi:signal transduction histidine kinase